MSSFDLSRELAVAPFDPPPRVGALVLLGHPVTHSLSPTFQNAALEAAGIPLHYRTLDVRPGALEATVADLRAQAAAGNVTIPHKARVAAVCDRRTPVATRAEAVNTFWVDAAGALVGDNTDVAGFTSAALHLLGLASPGRPADARGAQPTAPAPAGLRLAVLGAGGAAAAVLTAAEFWTDGRVRLWSRRPEAAHALAERFPGVRVAASAADACRDATLVVNATSLGLHPADALPCDVAALMPGAAVLDLVYAPAETAWVHRARNAGHPAADGLVMLVEQGAAAFVRWFGREPDRARMWDAVCARTGRTRPEARR